MSDTHTTTDAGTTASGHDIAALDDLMSRMRGHCSFVRRLLDDAATIIETARDDRARGRDVGVALNHARMLLEQVETVYRSVEDLAEGVSALYERRPRHWTHTYGRMPMSHLIYPDIQDRIDLLRSKLEQVRAMDAGAPDSKSPEAYRDLILNHDVGHINVLGLADEETAPPSIAAAKILYLHYMLMCCIMNGRSFHGSDRSSIQVIVQCINWTGWAFHNMPEMATGKHDRWHPEFFVSECRSFVESARTKPVPADWHPSGNRWDDNPGYTWKRLCDFVALQAGMEPTYGVPVEPKSFKIDIPAYPEPPRPILGMHTAGSVKRYWEEVGYWCQDWARAQRAAMSLWPEPETLRDETPQ